MEEIIIKDLREILRCAQDDRVGVQDDRAKRRVWHDGQGASSPSIPQGFGSRAQDDRAKRGVTVLAHCTQ